MTTQPAVFHAFPDVDELDAEFENGDALNPVRGILFGIVVCVPFWAAAVYLVLRSI